MIRNVLEARTEKLLMIAAIEYYRVHLPLDGINVSIARSTRVLVVCGFMVIHGSSVEIRELFPYPLASPPLPHMPANYLQVLACP
jgi:hypothetical protein